jgi:O-antigen ligase
MNGLFYIKDSLANKISYYHLVLLMASLPFDRFYSHLILISFAIHTLIHLKRSEIKPIFRYRTLLLQSVFFVTVLSTIYTINRPEAFNEWGKHITIFLFPVLFCLNPLDLKKYLPQLFTWFALICTATIVYLYADALMVIRHYHLPLKTLFSAAFTNHNFSQPIDMHATFFSMQITLALVYLLSVLVEAPRFYHKPLELICSLILVAGLIQLGSKSIFISLVILLMVVLPLFLLTGMRRIKFVAFAGLVLIAAVVLIFNSGALRKRYFTELKHDLTKSEAGAPTDSRLARWAAAGHLIAKRPVIGYGAGSEIGLLQDEFYKEGLFNSYLNRLNSHSEYLSFLLKSGIIGLLVYLTTLAFGFINAIRKRDLLFFTFMLLIAIVSLSENLLDVDKGIFFYAFFFTFFIFSNETAEEKPLRPITAKMPAIENLPVTA